MVTVSRRTFHRLGITIPLVLATRRSQARKVSDMGHPDWQSYAQWRGPVFAQTNVLVTNLNPISIGQNVTNYASTFLTVSNAGPSGVIVQISFSSDGTETDPLSPIVWNLPSGWRLTVVTPTIKNFARLLVQVQPAQTATVSVQWSPNNINPPKERYIGNSSTVSFASVSIPANTTQTFQPGVLSDGNGTYFFEDTGASAKLDVTIFTVDQTGALLYRLAEVPALGAIASGTWQNDAQPWVVRVQNTDAAAAHVIRGYATISNAE